MRRRHKVQSKNLSSRKDPCHAAFSARMSNTGILNSTPAVGGVRGPLNSGTRDLGVCEGGKSGSREEERTTGVYPALDSVCLLTINIFSLVHLLRQPSFSF